ncbi:unnamed protein product [Peniophora sp. CBMAI 1063]|nr:unnamed protein product [Peniophora sp. CBMAI 1063]
MVNTTVPAPSAAAQEEWPDADFDLADDEPLSARVASHVQADDEEDEDWDLDMDLGKTGGAKAQAVVAGIAARSSSGALRGMVTIRPPIAATSMSVSEDDEDEEGLSTIKMATLRPSAPPSQQVQPLPSLAVPEEDFEADFDLSGDLTQLSLRPLSHQGSKSSLEWGDKDQTSSSQSSDAYSTLGFDRHSISSNSTQPESGTEDDDEEDLDGLVIPSSIFDSGKAAKHLARVLEQKKVLAESPAAPTKIASPNPEDDFESGLVIDDDADFSPSRLRQAQLQARRSPLAPRANSLPTRSGASSRPPSRLRAGAKSPIYPGNPPLSSQRALERANRMSPSPPPRVTPVRSQSALLAPSAATNKPGSLRGQKSHTGLNPSPTSATAPRRLTRKASLSSLMDTGLQPPTSATAGPSSGSQPRYDAPTAASRARVHGTTGRIRTSLEQAVPPTRPSTPSSSGALRLTMPTNSSRLKTRPPITSVFPSPIYPNGRTSPLPNRPPSSLPLRAQRASSQQPIAGPSTGPKVLRKPKRAKAYGDGTELDGFDDLPTDSHKESQYRVTPKGYGNRVPGASYSPRKSAEGSNAKNTGTMRRGKSRRDLGTDSGTESLRASAAPVRTLKRTASSRIDMNKAASPPEPPRRKKVPSSPQQRRKPTLIRNLGGTSAPKVVGEMQWNPATLRWEGNDNALRDFDAALAPTRPALITHLTGSSVGSPVGSFANGARRVGNMVFDPSRMCWISTLAPEDDEPDVFADLADDEGDWEARGATIRASQQTQSSDLASQPPSPARSVKSRVRSPSVESVSDRGSRASMVCDVDETFFDACRLAEERHSKEMRGWRGKLEDGFDADRSFLYEIRALATRKY